VACFYSISIRNGWELALLSDLLVDFQRSLLVLLDDIPHWISKFLLPYEMKVSLPHLILRTLIRQLMFFLSLFLLLYQPSAPSSDTCIIRFNGSLVDIRLS
jgi:hypothetical protein